MAMSDDHHENQRLIESEARGERWRQGFLVEAARAASGRELSRSIRAAVHAVDLPAGSHELGRLMLQIGQLLGEFDRRWDRAPGLPGALELLEPETKAILELAGLKQLLEPLREAVSVQLAIDRDFRRSGLELFEDDAPSEVVIPVKLLRALGGVLGLDIQAVK